MPMGIPEIRTLIDLLDGSSIGELELETEEGRLVLRKQAGITAPVAGPAPAAPAVVPAPLAEAAPPKPVVSTSAHKLVKAPMVGTFYRAPSPESPPYVEVGTPVAVGSVLCIIEAMKLLNEIECEVAGTIKAVLVNNGEPVEFGQPLFEIE